MVKKRRVKHGSKRPVQRFNKSFEQRSSRRRKRFTGDSSAGVLPNPLPKRALKILSVLAADGVAEQAMVAAECVKSNVSYWVKRFIAAGILILRETKVPNSKGPVGEAPEYKPGHPHYYDLTVVGSKLLTLGDGRLYLPILFEDRPVIFRVLRREQLTIPWKPMGDVRHWRKFGVMLGGVTVELHDKLGPNHDQANLEIHPGHIKGFNVDECLMDSVRIVERVKFILESNYGIELSQVGELPKGSGPRWRVYVPAAKEWVVPGTVDVSGVGAVDASPEPSKSGVRDPLSQVPHVEFNRSEDAALMASLYGSGRSLSYDPAKQNTLDAVMAPTILRETHRLVNSLVSRVDSLSVEVCSMRSGFSQVGGVMVELKRLADSLSKLDNLERLPEITLNLQRIAGVLGGLADLESGQSRVEGKGGNDYVS